MKIQDILFLIVLIGLLFKHKESFFLTVGILCFLISIPLFYLQVFFTAERLVWYGLLFILIEIIFKAFNIFNEKV